MTIVFSGPILPLNTAPLATPMIRYFFPSFLGLLCAATFSAAIEKVVLNEMSLTPPSPRAAAITDVVIANASRLGLQTNELRGAVSYVLDKAASAGSLEPASKIDVLDALNARARLIANDPVIHRDEIAALSRLPKPILERLIKGETAITLTPLLSSTPEDTARFSAWFDQARSGVASLDPAANAVLPTSEKLSFMGVGTRDVYNLTAPFKANFRSQEHEILAARVELRESEDSETIFFEKAGEHWRPLAGTPVWKLQDPFFSKVEGELIIGGVQTFAQTDGGTGYYTVFYRGKDLADLKPFARGPNGMKDIRLLEASSGKIVVLTRPQGKIGGRGKIAVTVIDDLESLGPDSIGKATVLEGLFSPEQWGGVNELHRLKDGRIGVLGHIAMFDTAGNRHYYPMAFTLDAVTHQRSPMKILLRRSQLPPGASKRPDLADVLFSGGLVRGENGTAVLYVGAGDAEAYRVAIPDPFIEPLQSIDSN